jgi:hypothetical protein
MNLQGVKSIYMFEMTRAWRTVFQSVVSPVISTSLYFVVFSVPESQKSRVYPTVRLLCQD